MNSAANAEGWQVVSGLSRLSPRERFHKYAAIGILGLSPSYLIRFWAHPNQLLAENGEFWFGELANANSRFLAPAHFVAGFARMQPRRYTGQNQIA